MEEAFKKLQKEGKNDVDNIVKWMKDSKVIEATKEQEEKVRNLFKDVADPKNIPLDKFKEIMKELAEVLKKNFDGLAKQLTEGGGSKLMQAAMGATSKLKDLAKK